MAQGVKVQNTVPIGSVEQAISSGNWPAARKRMALKLARMFDATDSARDVKAISMSLEPMVARCEQDEREAMAEKNTPLADILAMADKAESA